MKFFGYPADTSIDCEEPTRLKEVTLCTDASTLRKISEFLLLVAEEMDQHGDAFGHEHFEDFDRSQPVKPAFIVMGDSSVSDS